MGRAMVILYLGALVCFGVLSANTVRRANEAVAVGVDYYEEAVARNLAESAANIGACRLTFDPDDFRGVVGPFELGGGSMQAVVSKIPRTGSVRVSGIGTFGAATRTINGQFSIIPTFILGAVSGNVDVQTLGSMVIDGRDHEFDGDVVPGEGMFSVLSTADIAQGGSSRFGGTDADGFDHAPTRNPDPEITEPQADLFQEYPDTPEGVLGGAEAGFPPGFLKEYAQSGQNGSQYVTDPNDLQFPLNGVTYVELPNNGLWQNIRFGNPPNHSRGILVVHNQWANARMKLLQHGLFEGILIVDQIDKIHCEIRGALVIMGGPQVGNCIGNGNGEINYSTEIIQHYISAVGKRVVKMVGWYAS
jgi:hypothetical protein